MDRTSTLQKLCNKHNATKRACPRPIVSETKTCSPSSKARGDIVDALKGRVALCILTGAAPKSFDTEVLVKSLMQRLGSTLGNNVVYVTKGRQHIAKHFVESCEDESRVLDLHAKCLEAGLTTHDCEVLFKQIGDIYVIIEGDRCVAKEANEVWARGAAVLPLMRTGGASAGRFGLEPKILDRLNHLAMKDSAWQRLKDETIPSDEVLDEISMIIRNVTSRLHDSKPGNLSFVPRNQTDERLVNHRLCPNYDKDSSANFAAPPDFRETPYAYWSALHVSFQAAKQPRCEFPESPVVSTPPQTLDVKDLSPNPQHESPKKTWRVLAGRSRGREGYQLGDVARLVAVRLAPRLRRCGGSRDQEF